MGSGQPIADPFIAFISKAMFGKKKPKLNEGVFAVFWALQHAIDLNAGGINGPAQIATLSKGAGTRLAAKILSLDDLSEHAGLVVGLDACISGYREILSGKTPPSTQVPTIPAMPQLA